MATDTPDRGESVPESAHTLLESPARRSIVDLLANQTPTDDSSGELPGLTAAELAARLGLHVTTIRFHLDRLVSADLLESEFRAGQVGRPRKIYRFRPRAVSTGSSQDAYRALAELLAEAWGEGDGGLRLSPEEAGKRWAHRHVDIARGDEQPARTPGAWIGKVGRTVDMLDRWGYTPELRTTDDGLRAELTLLNCPFLPLAETNTDVVCGVHRGLLKGAMDAVGEPDTQVALRPFVGPSRCLATLTRPPVTPENHPRTPTAPAEETQP